MNKSVLISIIALYGAATMGCADDVMGRAPTHLSGSVLGFGLDFKKCGSLGDWEKPLINNCHFYR